MTSRESLVVDSPFLERAKDCYLNRRRHSKKIRKLAMNMSKTTKRDRMKDPEGSIVMGLLLDRKIPETLIDIIRKKRIWNVSCIRKLVFNPSVEDQLMCLKTLAEERARQEQDLHNILQENEGRFEEHRRNAASLKLKRKQTAVTAAQANSSTESLESGSEDADGINYAQAAESSMEQSADHSGYRNNIFDFEGPLDFMVRDLDEENLFVQMF